MPLHCADRLHLVIWSFPTTHAIHCQVTEVRWRRVVKGLTRRTMRRLRVPSRLLKVCEHHLMCVSNVQCRLAVWKVVGTSRSLLRVDSAALPTHPHPPAPTATRNDPIILTEPPTRLTHPPGHLVCCSGRDGTTDHRRRTESEWEWEGGGSWDSGESECAGNTTPCTQAWKGVHSDGDCHRCRLIRACGYHRDSAQKREEDREYQPT